MARNKYDIDEVMEDKFDLNQLKRVFQYVKPYRSQLALALFLMLSASALTMLFPLFISEIMDTYIPEKNIRAIVVLTLLSLVIVLYTCVCIRLKIRITSRIGQTIVHQLRSDIFCHLQELPFSYYDDRPHGKIQVRVVNYVNSLSDLLSNGIINTITDMCNLIFIMIFMFLLHVRLTLICLCGLPVLIGVIIFVKKRQRRAWQIQSNKQSNLTAYIAESINGIRVTQSFVRERENASIFNHLSDSYRSAWMRAVKYNFIMWPCIDSISTVTTALIYVVGICWISGDIYGVTVGILIAFTSYISRFWEPINTLASFYNSLLTAIAYLERIFETIDEPVNVKDAADAVTMPPIDGKVAFKEVCFSYEDGVQILNKVSFTANPGDTYAIVGPTGAGKSTIVNLISRFYNVDSGSILIDGTDISHVTLKSLRSQMGIMMQDSFIFSGTIMDNIRYGRLDATDEECVQAAKAANADGFIRRLPEGYHTRITGDGANLSQGQRQLLAIARAAVKDPPIMVLDEATSSIDTRTERYIQRGMDALMEGRTVFVIAHRLSTVRNADCIVVIEGGRIMEKGSHAQLMEERGRYYQLYTGQFELD